jgi:hypothetical protein
MARLRPLTLLATTAFVAVGALTSACGNSPKPAAIAGGKVTLLAKPAPPDHLLGLTVHPEDMTHQMQAIPLTYVESTALYSLRRDDVVQGTLQVSRFNGESAYQNDKFRQAFLVQLSGTAPQAYKLAGQTVYQTNSLRQRLAVWFEGQNVYVLSTRDEFDHPRDLIRAALALPQ